MMVNGIQALILADLNPRSTIAILRALKGTNTTIFLAFKNRKPSNRLLYMSHPSVKSVFTYCADNEQAFIRSIVEISEQVGTFTLFLSDEKSVGRWAVANREYLAKQGVILPRIDLEQLDLLSDKWKFRELSARYGFKVPAQVVPQANRKFVVKPIGPEPEEGKLRKPLLVTTPEAWRRFQALRLDLAKHYVEEYVEGFSIYYTAAYKNGKKVMSFVQRNVHQLPDGGSIIAAVPYSLPHHIEARLDQMIESLQWDSVLMIELRWNRADGEFYAIECNPRFWGPLQLAVDNGYNYPAIYLGLDVQAVPYQQQLIGYRWLSGYIRGLAAMAMSGVPFEIHATDGLNGSVKYADLWLRKDTFFYFLWETGRAVLSAIKHGIKIPVRTAKRIGLSTIRGNG